MPLDSKDLTINMLSEDALLETFDCSANQTQGGMAPAGAHISEMVKRYLGVYQVTCRDWSVEPKLPRVSSAGQRCLSSYIKLATG
jgi:hypothetical protein